MTFLDWLYFALGTIKYKLEHSAPFMGFMVAVVVASLRTARDGTPMIAKGIESLLCGIFAYVLLKVLPFIGMDIAWSGFVAAAIGYFGTRNTANFLKHKLLGLPFGGTTNDKDSDSKGRSQ